jgi:hypothetical protein
MFDKEKSAIIIDMYKKAYYEQILMLRVCQASDEYTIEQSSIYSGWEAANVHENQAEVYYAKKYYAEAIRNILETFNIISGHDLMDLSLQIQNNVDETIEYDYLLKIQPLDEDADMETFLKVNEKYFSIFKGLSVRNYKK